jgi:hypothetical protein
VAKFQKSWVSNGNLATIILILTFIPWLAAQFLDDTPPEQLDKMLYYVFGLWAANKLAIKKIEGSSGAKEKEKEKGEVDAE